MHFAPFVPRGPPQNASNPQVVIRSMVQPTTQASTQQQFVQPGQQQFVQPGQQTPRQFINQGRQTQQEQQQEFVHQGQPVQQQEFVQQEQSTQQQFVQQGQAAEQFGFHQQQYPVKQEFPTQVGTLPIFKFVTFHQTSSLELPYPLAINVSLREAYMVEKWRKDEASGIRGHRRSGHYSSGSST